MRRLALRPATLQEWEESVGGCDAATFFHTPQWARVWEVYTDGAQIPAAQIAEFPDRTKVLIPMSATRLRWGLERYESTATGKYGGWLAPEALSKDRARSVWTALAALSVTVRQNPLDPTQSDPSFGWTRADFTQMVSLNDDFERILAGWSPRHRAAVRKAELAGVEVAIDLRAWDEYFDLYQAARRRWGDDSRTDHRRELFHLISNAEGASGTGPALWVARYGGEMVAGAILLYHRRHVVYWHGASNEEGLRQKAATLLHHHAMRDATLKGLSWYDFNPSGGLPGVAEFKRRFGAHEKQSNVFVTRSRVYRGYELLARRAHR